MHQSLRGQGQAAQTIRMERIHARLVEDDFRLEAPDFGKCVIESRQIYVVPGEIRKFDVDGPFLLLEREIIRPMHREGQYARIVLKNRSRSITLVYVEIDHCRPPILRAFCSARIATATSLNTQKPAPSAGKA